MKRNPTRCGGAEVGLGLIFAIVVATIFVMKIKSCSHTALSVADTNSTSLFSYIESMGVVGSFYVLVINVTVCIIFSLVTCIGFALADISQENEVSLIFGSSIVGLVLGFVGLLVTAGNMTCMVSTNVIFSGIACAGISISNVRYDQEGKIYATVVSSTVVSIVVIAILYVSIGLFWFKPSSDRRVRISTPLVVAKEKESPIEKLRHLTSRKLPTILKQLESDKIELNNRLERAKGLEKEVLLKELSELEITQERASKYFETCCVLAIRYDSAHRIVERNRKLGNLMNETADSDLSKIEDEIREFLKESLAEKLKRD